MFFVFRVFVAIHAVPIEWDGSFVRRTIEVGGTLV